MSKQVLEALGGGIGCIIGTALWLGGPVATAWLCIEVFEWPVWLGVLIGLLAGGMLGYIVVLLLVAPIMWVASLFEK